MEEADAPNPSNLCGGCLSYDRKVQIPDVESQNLFVSLLDPLFVVRNPLHLCWECLYRIYNIVKFKSQVRLAQETLCSLQVKNFSPPTCLSKLQTSVTESLIHDAKGEGFHLYSRAPLFIKIEEHSFEGDDCDVFADDPGDMKTDLEVNQNEEDVKTKEQFSDSDDEPLSMKPKASKAMDNQVVVNDVRKSKKRKKSDGKDPKPDPPKKRGRPKKEKAVGVIRNNKKANRKLAQLNVDDSQVQLVVLSWEEVEAERQSALTNESFTRLEYKCYNCVIGFNHRVKLDNHMKKHDPSAGTMECATCKVRCKDARALEAHIRRHRVRWRCAECGGRWSRAAVAADHAARAHGAPDPTHRCKICGHVAPTLGKLRVHSKIHGARQKCELCGKTFKDRASLRTHLFIHKGEKEYSCPHCRKLFLFKKAMEIHMVTHLEPAHLYCYECDMTFKNRMSYYGHMKYNLKHIDPAKLKYECQLCEKKFSKAVRLEEHRAAIHLKVTPIKCTVTGCQFACASRAVLRAHIRSRHVAARAPRHHVCHVCGKAYTTKKSLEGHMRVHTGERPFQCHLCPSSFGYEAALYNHNKLVHRKEKQLTKRSDQEVSYPGASWDVEIRVV